MSEKYSINNSNTFLSFYNQIDKYFSYVLWLTKYVSYHEKITWIVEWSYPITQFVRLYQNKLRYFGDMRNQLVHGFRLDNHHYVLASNYALKEIDILYKELREPTRAIDVFAREVYTCRLGDLLVEVIRSMKEDLNTHVPVYDDHWDFVEMLSESTIAYWIAEQIGDDGEIHLKDVIVADVPLKNSNDLFVFVDEKMSIYDIEQLFVKKREAKKRLWAVFITHNGLVEEEIVGIVTAMDVPLLADHFVL